MSHAFYILMDCQYLKTISCFPIQGLFHHVHLAVQQHTAVYLGPPNALWEVCSPGTWKSQVCKYFVLFKNEKLRQGK